MDEMCMPILHQCQPRTRTMDLMILAHRLNPWATLTHCPPFSASPPQPFFHHARCISSFASHPLPKIMWGRGGSNPRPIDVQPFASPLGHTPNTAPPDDDNHKLGVITNHSGVVAVVTAANWPVVHHRHAYIGECILC